MGRIRILNSKDSQPDPKKSFPIHNTGGTVQSVLAGRWLELQLGLTRTLC